MTFEEIKECIKNDIPLKWNDPLPIEGNDYRISYINLGEEITLIQYNDGWSEAEVFNSEISKL